MQSLALATAASRATTAALATESGCCPFAASQASASAASARQSISAHRCLTAWNAPIGWPNCSRTLAWSTATVRHRRATPAASAAAKVAARSATGGTVRTSPGRTPENRMRASGREKSNASSGSTVTPGVPGASRTWPPSTGTSSQVPASAPGTGPVTPSASDGASSSTATVASPSARAGSSSFASGTSASRSPASAVPSTGPGTSSSAAAASPAARSATPPSAPPAAAGSATPNRPSAAKPAGIPAPGPVSAVRTASRGWCAADQAWIASASAICSSVSATGMGPPRGTGRVGCCPPGSHSGPASDRPRRLPAGCATLLASVERVTVFRPVGQLLNVSPGQVLYVMNWNKFRRTGECRCQARPRPAATA